MTPVHIPQLSPSTLHLHPSDEIPSPPPTAMQCQHPQRAMQCEHLLGGDPMRVLALHGGRGGEMHRIAWVQPRPFLERLHQRTDGGGCERRGVKGAGRGVRKSGDGPLRTDAPLPTSGGPGNQLHPRKSHTRLLGTVLCCFVIHLSSAFARVSNGGGPRLCSGGRPALPRHWLRSPVVHIPLRAPLLPTSEQGLMTRLTARPASAPLILRLRHPQTPRRASVIARAAHHKPAVRTLQWSEAADDPSRDALRGPLQQTTPRSPATPPRSTNMANQR